MSALPKFMPRPEGRHHQIKDRRGMPRLPWVSGAILAAVAAGAAMALAITSAPAAPASAAGYYDVTAPAVPTMTQAQASELKHVLATPSGRADALRALRESFGSTGARVGIGPQSTSGQKSPTVLTAYDWQTGITGNHIWVIASYNDLYGWSWAYIAWKCGEYFPDIAAACAIVGAGLGSLAIGHGDSPNHGVWVAGYFISYGSLADAMFYRWDWGRY